MATGAVHQNAQVKNVRKQNMVYPKTDVTCLPLRAQELSDELYNALRGDPSTHHLADKRAEELRREQNQAEQANADGRAKHAAEKLRNYGANSYGVHANDVHDQQAHGARANSLQRTAADIRDQVESRAARLLEQGQPIEVKHSSDDDMRDTKNESDLNELRYELRYSKQQLSEARAEIRSQVKSASLCILFTVGVSFFFFDECGFLPSFRRRLGRGSTRSMSAM